MTEERRIRRAAQARAYYTTHKSRQRAAHALWLKNNKEKVKKQRAAYRFANRGKLNAYCAAWRIANREKYRAALGRRKADKLNATPRWANQAKIAEFYETADGLGMLIGEQYNVDHIVPLKSRMVCGLHCEQNLQVIPAIDNFKKYNIAWPDMP